MLETSVSQGQKHAREINRARILLLANEGRKVKEIAKVLGVSTTTVSYVRKRDHQTGYQHILHVLKDAPRSGRPITLDRRVEANVTMMACSEPPEGAARWTLHLLADQLVQLDAVDSIAHDRVRSIFKKANANPG